MAETTLPRQGATISEDMAQAEVPHVVHQIWLQGKPAGEPGFLTDRVGKMCDAAGWAYCLWSDESLAAAFPDYRRLRSGCVTVSQAADLGRFLVLYHCGGLYLDADVELYKLPLGLRGAWIWSAGNIDRNVSCAVMAMPAGHPYGARLLAEWEKPSGHRMQNVWGMLVSAAALGRDVHYFPRGDWSGQHSRYGWHRGRCREWKSARPDL